MKEIKFIADIGSNHNKSFDRIKKLLEKTKDVGFDAVKFQLFDENIWRYENDTQIIQHLKKRKLPLEFIPTLADLCRFFGLEFHCTPFNYKAIDLLKDRVDAFKIGSYEILCTRLIEQCAQTGKPLGISFGLSDRKRMLECLRIVNKYLKVDKITAYHCCSEYPAKPENCSIGYLNKMALELAFLFPETEVINLGWSDHTCNEDLIMTAALATPINHIEMHVDLNDMIGYESEHGHCWSIEAAGSIISRIRNSLLLLFDCTPLHNTELMNSRTDPSDLKRPLKGKTDENQD